MAHPGTYLTAAHGFKADSGKASDVAFMSSRQSSRLPSGPCKNARLFGEADLAQVAQRARMNQIEARRGGQRVGRGRLARLREFLAERVLGAVERARQPIGDALVERR